MKKTYRQQYHLMPETGFLNDPNGLCFYKGEYHIFHQYAPQGLSAQRGWGHFTTKDFVNYKNYGMVIFPDSVWDKNGSYSGSALIDDGEMELFYTGNVKQPGNHDYTTSGREQNLIYTTSKDGVTFSEKELLMTNDDYPENCSCHVRDPKVWKEGENLYKMILGARTMDDRGEALIYKSSDKKHWSLDKIYTKHGLGYMWECPDFFELDGKTFLCCCPQGVEPQGMEFNNIYQSGYMMLEGDELSKFVELDRGFDFYAPQTFLTPDGRRIIIGWFGLPDVPYKNPTEETENWIHCLTLPRTLEYKDNKIWQEPIAELEKLRNHEVTVELEKGKPNIFPTVQCEALISFEKETDNFEIDLRKDVNISLKDGVFTLTMGDSGMGRTKRSCLVDKTDKVRIYSDTSSLEIFVNGEVFSTRIYDDLELSEDFSVVLNSTSQGCKLAYYTLRPFEITKIS